MNKIWLYLVTIGCIVMLFVCPDSIMPTMVSAGEKSIKLCVNLIGVYTIWMGLLQLLDDCGITQKLSSLLSPVIDKLFGKLDDTTKKLISINLSANMLGVGGASTPSGIKAMSRLDNKSGKPNKAMIMLIVLNATSIQLLPTTVIGMRITAGSSNPADIVLPSLLATIVTSVLGILLVNLFCKIKKVT